jgi:non-canonical poly(A) RNA polymerase PAPD5/7
MVKRYWNDADIRCFGSFAAGLYLPTSDMDLVCVSEAFLHRGKPVLGSKGHLFKFGGFLEGNHICTKGSVEVIAKARVPIVKFVDELTGLKVDVSFENDSGLMANDTFQNWKTVFPAMPIIVTLIKQFLAMRGLNEVVNGGLGGFSVACLVTSLLQNMPQVQSGNLIPEHHLGDILMEFFDLYGNEFNMSAAGIQFNPPGYFDKVHSDLTMIEMVRSANS